jgi:hypothetical protein
MDRLRWLRVPWRSFSYIYRPREALQRRHTGGDDADAAMTTSTLRARILAWKDKTDARLVGRGSERACGVRPILIVDEQTADWRCRGVELGEEDEDVFPLRLISKRYPGLG